MAASPDTRKRTKGQQKTSDTGTRRTSAISTPWSPGIDVAWTVPKVRTTLEAHEGGDFSSSSKMVDAMGRDDRITAVLETRIAGLLSAGRTVTPKRETPGAQRLAALVSEQIESWLPRDYVTQAQRWYHMLGLSLTQLEWHANANEWHPHAAIWEPQFLKYDADKKNYVVTTENGELPLDWDSGQWFLLSVGERPWMAGAVRSIATLWLTRAFCWRDHNRYNERHGLPIVKGMIPAMSSTEDKDTFEAGLRAMANKTTIQLPQNVDGVGNSYDAQLLEAKDGSYETFMRLLGEANSSIAIRLLGQNLTTEVTGGSRAAAQVHDHIRADHIESDARQQSELENQILSVWATRNGHDPEDVPVISYAVEPPEDVRAIGSTLVQLGDGLEKLQRTGVTLTADAKAELFARIGVDIENGTPDDTPDPEDAPNPRV